LNYDSIYYWQSFIAKEKDNQVIYIADNYHGTLELLNNNIIRIDEVLIENFKEDYRFIEKLEKEFNLEELNRFCQSFNNNLDYHIC
jgi:hypothetical protein